MSFKYFDESFQLLSDLSFSLKARWNWHLSYASLLY